MPPRQVFVQAGERVALHHLAQRAGPMARAARRAVVDQPLQLDQASKRTPGAAARLAGARRDAVGEHGRMGCGRGGDPRRQRVQVDAAHRATSRERMVAPMDGDGARNNGGARRRIRPALAALPAFGLPGP